MTLTAPRTAPANPEERQVTAVLRDAEDAWNRRDLQAFAALFAPEAGYIARNNVMLRGRREIERAQKEAQAGPLRGMQLKLTANRIEFLAPQVVVVDALVCLTPEERGVRTTDARSTLVLAKGEEGWRIYAAHTSYRTATERDARVT
jgi:uncharacterized protein (TIGR02246 family)